MMSDPPPESEAGRPTGSEYADSLRAVLDHAARVEGSEGLRIEARAPLLTRPPVVVAVLLTFAAVVAYNVRSLRSDAEPLPPAEEAAAVRVSALVVGQLIESYRAEHGRLPVSLAELGVPAEGLEYVVVGDDYELRVAGASEEVVLEGSEGPAGLLQGLELPSTAPETGR